MKFCFLNENGEQTSDTLFRKVDCKNGTILSPLKTDTTLYHCLHFNDEVLGEFTLAIESNFFNGLAVLEIANQNIHTIVYFTQYEKKLLEKNFQ